MKVTLKKDLLLGDNSLGHAGKSYTVSATLGHHLVQQGFAEAGATEEAEAEPETEATDKPKKGKVSTTAIGSFETK